MALITQADLEKRVTPQTAASYLDDDGDGAADAAAVAEVLEEASDVASGILLGSFSAQQIADLAANDFSVRGAVSDVAADLMARRRSEVLAADGSTPYTAWRKNAEVVLERVARAQRRFKAESTQGINRNLRARANVDPPPAVFASTKDNPRGPGGF